VQNERNHRAVGQLGGERFELVTREFFPRDSGAERVSKRSSIAGNKLLSLKPLEQRLHRGVVRRRAGRVELIANIARGERPAIPEQLQNGKLGVGGLRPIGRHGEDPTVRVLEFKDSVSADSKTGRLQLQEHSRKFLKR